MTYEACTKVGDAMNETPVARIIHVCQREGKLYPQSARYTLALLRPVC
jgi:hypothetical protein